MQRYVSDLRSITQGRGVFSTEFIRYEQMPSHLTEQIIAKAQREAEEK
jgi:elongation factor G